MNKARSVKEIIKRRFAFLLVVLAALPVITLPVMASLSVPALADPNDNGGSAGH